MNCRTVGLVFLAAIFAAINLSITTPAQTTPFTKPQVADRIRKVEDGVDQFQKYLENRGQDAKNRAETARVNPGKPGTDGTFPVFYMDRWRPKWGQSRLSPQISLLLPSRMIASQGATPAAITRTRTSFGPGEGIGTSSTTTTSGGPKL